MTLAINYAMTGMIPPIGRAKAFKNVLTRGLPVNVLAMKRLSCLICVLGYWLLAKLRRRQFRRFLQGKLKSARSRSWFFRCLAAWLVVTDVESGDPERILESFRQFKDSFELGVRTLVAAMESAVWLQDGEAAEDVLVDSRGINLSEREYQYLRALNNWAFNRSPGDIIALDGPPATASLIYVFHFAKAMALDGVGHQDALAHFRDAMREMPINAWQYQVAMDRCNALLNEG